jgi:hypothetical protein
MPEKDETKRELTLDEERERWLDDRYDKLSDRVAKLEKRGRLLQSMNEEKVYLWLFGAYIFFGFVVPTIRELVGGKTEAK